MGGTTDAGRGAPNSRDLDREGEARRELEAANLVLGNVTGTGVVDAQSHAPGVLV